MQEAKAAMDNLIRETLYAELLECYMRSAPWYLQHIYEYVYTQYKAVAYFDIQVIYDKSSKYL